MSLNKKIVLAFLISAFIIGVLAAIEYVGFVEVRKQIRFLELTDTIRSKTLQLRRHEKNFFLYGPQKGEESRAVHQYVSEIDDILAEGPRADNAAELARLRGLVAEYGGRFTAIERAAGRLTGEIETEKAASTGIEKVYPLIGLTFLERPREEADFLEGSSLLPAGHQVVSGLRELDGEINLLRKNGEDILALSKDLDRTARGQADRVVGLSQTAIIVIFPIFLVVGVGSFFLIMSGVTSRLRLLTDVVERAGGGTYPHVQPAGAGPRDEVGLLIEKFNEMEEQLCQREQEIKAKNEELLQARKLAAIGTLASGVAHELNNPLNNIYISAQVLQRESSGACPPEVKGIIGDIAGEAARVKRIVSDLLEFARGKEPRKRRTELGEFVKEVYRTLGGSRAHGLDRVHFEVKTEPGGVFAEIDPDQMERVFSNLFMNAVDAMAGEGAISLAVERGKGGARVTVSDTGAGIAPEDLDKVFDPFFTTKDKGTGLGLAIAFNIVKKHGGEISVTSGKGAGTRFTVTLPERG